MTSEADERGEPTGAPASVDVSAAARPPAFYRLENTVQPYDWGSTSAIQDLLGVEPDGRPAAELWMGAHPLAPSRVVPDGKSEEAALECAAGLASGSRTVLGLTVRHLRRLAVPHFENSLDRAERAYLDELAREPDMDEGVRAFVEKRAPRWSAAGGGSR